MTFLYLAVTNDAIVVNWSLMTSYNSEQISTNKYNFIDYL